MTEKNDRITRVWQKWRFSAPQTHLWLIKVWFSASIFVVKIRHFAMPQNVRRYLKNDTMNYNDKKFRPISNTENGETSNETLFHYKQVGNMLTSEYSGGKIKFGHLIGLVDKSGTINMRYHQVNDKDELMTGMCISKPEILENGKIRLHETWEWTSGDKSKGTSIIEEL